MQEVQQSIERAYNDMFNSNIDDKRIVILQVESPAVWCRRNDDATTIPVSFVSKGVDPRRVFSDRLLRAKKLVVIVETLDQLCPRKMISLTHEEYCDSNGNRLFRKQLVVLSKSDPSMSKMFNNMLFRDHALASRCHIECINK